MRLSRWLFWLMVGWALAVSLLTLPLDERFHVANGRPFAVLRAAHVGVWLALAAASSVRAVRQAEATRGRERAAWWGVPVAHAAALPAASWLLGTFRYTEDEGRTCSPGLLPAGVGDAADILASVSPWVYVAVLVAGLVCLAARPTRRPGTWILASVAMGVALGLSGSVLVNNHCG